MIARFLHLCFIFVALFIGGYISIEYALSHITLNVKPVEQTYAYRIYLKSNGAHTDIVLPIRNSVVEWGKFFNPKDTLGKKENFNYISIGWGDKGFYLNTPTWRDLKLKTAIIAAIGVGEAALHITYYDDIKEDELTKSLLITQSQYDSIVKTVKNSLILKENNPIYINTTAQYSQNDAFYEAKGSYSLLHTCNTWTNNTLKEARLKHAFWVAFDEGLLRLYTNEKKQSPE